MNSYKQYRKDINDIIKINKNSVKNTMDEMLNYYSTNLIEEKDLLKRYKNIYCYEKNFSSYIVGIIGGLISSIISSIILNIVTPNIFKLTILLILIGISPFIIIFIYNHSIKDFFAQDDEVFFYPYEKILIEKKLEQVEKIKINNSNLTLKQVINNKESNKGIQAHTYNAGAEERKLDDVSEELLKEFKKLSLKNKVEAIKIICEMAEKENE